MKFFITPLFFCLLLTSLYSQSNNIVVDSTLANIEFQTSKDLQYVDALAARDITYKWTNAPQKINNLKLEAQYHLLHAQHDQVCGSIEASIEVYSRAINTSLLYDSTSLVLAEAYARRGNALNIKGESQLGLKEIQKAKKIYSHHNKVEENLWCDALIADCYRQQNSFTKAFKRVETAIQKLEEHEPSLLLMDAYLIYGNTASLEKQIYPTSIFNEDRVEFYLHKVLKYSQKIKNRPYEAKALKLLADAKYIVGEYETSLQFGKKAASYFKESNFLLNWVGAKYSESQNLVHLGRSQEVIKTLEAPVDLAAKSGWLKELNQMYSFLAIAHATLGHHREGAINGSRAFTIYKHIVKEERAYEMETLEANYEKEKQMRIAAEAIKDVEMKQQQRNIALLILTFLVILLIVIFYAYKKISSKNKALNNSLSQKTILTQEVHHRVKNNLTLLKSLLYLRAKSSENKEVKMVLDECQSRIHSMALVHENLYTIEDSSQVDFNIFIHQLFEEINIMFNTTTNPVAIDINTHNVKIDMRNAVFLGLILNELLTNSYKYAFNDTSSKKINIELIKNNNSLLLNYEDNGIGLPKNCSLESSDGFGFKLITILVSQLNAKITYKKNQFSTFKITIPFEK